jgi:hypothetical protein
MYLNNENGNERSNKYEYGFELNVEKNTEQNYSFIIPIRKGWENFLIEDIVIINGDCSYHIENTSYGKGLKISSNTDLHLSVYKLSEECIMKYDEELTMVNYTDEFHSKIKIYCDVFPNNGSLNIEFEYYYLFTYEYEGTSSTSGIKHRVKDTIINGWQEVELDIVLYD